MTRGLIVHRAGPGVTVQDKGRPGHLAFGLSRGGAADPLALAEGAVLLRQNTYFAALEMAGTGGEFEPTEDLRIALTGAPMRGSVDGARLAWNASHLVPKGARLSIGAAEAGSYGYLHVGGGLEPPQHFGARSAHLAAGIGAPLASGARLAVGPDPGTEVGLRIAPEPRFDGGTVRIVSSLQTEFFPPSEIARFEATVFRKDNRGNRMGVRILPPGEGFHSDGGLSVLSEVIVPGDIQITGDGTPFVLLCECQTTGGYPRIGSVLPSDLPRIVQAQPGSELRFRFVALEEAVAIERRERDRQGGLHRHLVPLIRDPASIRDLLSYQLISGVFADDEVNGPSSAPSHKRG